MKFDLVTPGDPSEDPPSVARLLKARKLAWRVGTVLVGGTADNPRHVALAAAPFAEWFAGAATAADLTLRMDAARFWLSSTLDLLDAGVEPEGNPEAAASVTAAIYDWLADVPGYDPECSRIQADTPGPLLTGRQLFVIRCLLLRATEQGTPRPGLEVGELIDGAAEYAGTASPPVTAAEVDAVLRLVFKGSARDGAPGYDASTAGYGAQDAQEPPAGPAPADQVPGALLYPHGPDQGRNGVL